MPGKGKGKGKGKGGKRFTRGVGRDNIQGITNAAVRRMARRAGVKRMSGAVFYSDVRDEIKAFMDRVCQDASTYMTHARRKTVNAMDVVYALKRRGITHYGH